jgi:gliding motility-associated-like protein
LFVISSLATSAQAYLEFVENKGQWKGDIKFKGQMANGAFALQPSGYKVLLNNMDDIKAMNSYFHPHDIGNTAKKILPAEKDQFIVRSHVYAVKFLGANEQATIIPEKPLNTYNNYFIDNDPSKWASECKIYQAVTYQNIYPNIDVRYYTSNNHLKYDIIVKPGGDASKIAMYFDGVDGLRNKNGDLLIKTSVGDISELSPYSYQLTKTAKKDVPCSFEVRGNIVRFKTEGKIEDGATLVIDPTLIFCTFTGSTADNWGYTATYDAAGNLYAGGTVFSQGFPVSTGAYQTVYSGGPALGENLSYDIGIIKFNPTGANRIYATYIGGSNGSEQPHSLVVDNAGNLIVAGRTSASNYPTAPAGNSTYGAGGGWDIVVSKLNASGTQLIGSRRIGGTGSDGVNMYTNYASSGPKGTQSIRRNYGDDGRSEVIVDNAGNIYLASCTQSYNSFPTSTGAAQTTPVPTSGFYQDAVAIKLSPDLSTVLFSTLIGGADDDAAFVLSINPTNGNIYVAGATRSTSMPGNFSGSIFPNNQGGPSNATDGPIDGFIQVLNNTGTAFVKSTYIGTAGVDLIYGIQFDKFSYPYVMGTTTGSWPIFNAPFSQTGGKQFIAKLKQDLSGWEYSTVFGNNVAEPNLSPTAFLVDRCENVYVSGWGGKGNTMDQFQNAGTLGLSVTADAYKPSTDGSDFYFFVMERNAASQLYGSFFGQNLGGYPDHVDGGTSRFDRNGIIYQAVCANCFGGAAFPTTPGVWAETNGTGSAGCNLAAIKMAFNLSGVGSGVQSSIHGTNGDTSGCVPLTVSFRDTLAEGTKYIWNFGDGSPQVTTTAPNTSHLYTAIGSYRVMLVSIDSSKCNIADTSYLTMRVRNDDAPLAFDAYKLQPCTALAYNFVNNSVAPTNKPFKSNSFKWDFGDGTTQISGNQTVTHAYAAAGTYNVKLILIDTNYCNEPDTVIKQLRVSPVVKAQFETPTSGCAPYTALFNNTSLAGTDFIWDFGDGSPTSTAVNPIHLYSNVGTYTIKLIAIDTSTCNKIDSTSFTLVVSGKPTSAFVYTPNPPTPNTAIIFTNNAVGGSRYKWQFGDGDTLVTTNQNTLVSHIYNVTQLYRPCLITYNIYGCTDTTCQDLQARVIPAVAVPNAFTPNQDGNNDIIYVNGYGIKNMTWRIYNRWGTLVFTSTNKNNGWDGRYNGVMQPQDVYMYSLDVAFTDGTSYSTKGDITLLR